MREKSLLDKLPEIIRSSKTEYEQTAAGSYTTIERNRWTGNILAHSDNVPFMKYLIQIGMSGKLQLIYADPPFFSEEGVSRGSGVSREFFIKKVLLETKAVFFDN